MGIDFVHLAMCCLNRFERRNPVAWRPVMPVMLVLLDATPWLGRALWLHRSGANTAAWVRFVTPSLRMTWPM